MPRPGRSLRALALLAVLAGCGGGTEAVSIPHDGITRTAVIDRSGSPGPSPLIIVLHGALLDGAAMRGLTDLPGKARAAGATLAWPDAYGPVWNDLALAATLPGALSARDDIGFLDALIDRLVADGVADPARVHLVGISNGGMMAYAYACRRAERLASLIVFKATMAEDAAQTCRPGHTLPVLIAAGTDDPIVRWDGRVVLAGLVEVDRRLPVEDGFALWLARNGCTGRSAPETLPRRGAADAPRIERTTGLGCAAETALYAIVGGGHRLPGGEASLLYRALGPATPDAEAADLILGFALERRRP
jgi:polyhydroxybutyrate depolymerase